MRTLLDDKISDDGAFMGPDIHEVFVVAGVGVDAVKDRGGVVAELVDVRAPVDAVK